MLQVAAVLARRVFCTYVRPLCPPGEKRFCMKFEPSKYLKAEAVYGRGFVSPGS